MGESMTTKTIKFYRPELIGETNLVMRLHLPGRSAIINGTGTSATIDADGLITANVTETLTRELYALSIYDPVAVDFVWTPDNDSMLWMPGDAAGTYYAGSHALNEHALATGVPPGGESFSILILDDDNNPVDHCSCWVATDILGDNVITDIWETDNSGTVDFVLNPGTYYLFRQKNGVNFTTNPRSFTVA